MWLRNRQDMRVHCHCMSMLNLYRTNVKVFAAPRSTWVLKGAGRRMNCSTLTPGWKVSTNTAADTHGS